MHRLDVDVVVFDAVGTLIHPEPPAAEAYVIIGQRYGSRHAVEEIRRRFVAAFAHEEEADRRAGLRTSESREIGRWRNIVTSVLDDVSNAEACFQDLFAYFANPAAWRCEAAAGPVLGALGARGIRVGMASNFDARLRSVVAGFPELGPVTEHLVISSEIGWRKPASEFFQVLARRFGVAPERVLVVGDDLLNDYEGAAAAGFPSILFDPRGRAAVPQRIQSLSELIH